MSYKRSQIYALYEICAYDSKASELQTLFNFFQSDERKHSQSRYYEKKWSTGLQAVLRKYYNEKGKRLFDVSNVAWMNNKIVNLAFAFTG